MPSPIRLLVLAALVLSGCGASAEYKNAEAEWEAYQSAEARKARGHFEAGMALHGAYMKTKPPAGAKGPDAASAWFNSQTKLLGEMDAHFSQVQLTDFRRKGLVTRVRHGQAWEKLADELEVMVGALNTNAARQYLRPALHQAIFNYNSVQVSYLDIDPSLAQSERKYVSYAKNHQALLESKQAAVERALDP